MNASINGVFSSSKMRDIIIATNVTDEIVDKLKEVFLSKGTHSLKSLKVVGNTFKNANIQHDAVEFLECLLGYLEGPLPELSIMYTYN